MFNNKPQVQNNQIFYSKNIDKLNDTPRNKDKIFLFYQFFIHSNNERNKELKYCLKKNINLNLFSKIFLLNERIFTKDELGLSDDEMEKIIQINIGERLKFSILFLKIKQLNLNGYIVFSNCDIFFDKTLSNLHKTGLSISKSFYSLLRFEFKNEKKLGYCKLFLHPKNNLPRPDSQDTWIFHTNFSPSNEIIQQSNFEFGKPGCDNKIIFILNQNGYTCFNEPWKIKTYHFHNTQIRNYNAHDLIPGPYLFLIPNF